MRKKEPERNPRKRNYYVYVEDEIQALKFSMLYFEESGDACPNRKCDSEKYPFYVTLHVSEERFYEIKKELGLVMDYIGTSRDGNEYASWVLKE